MKLIIQSVFSISSNNFSQSKDPDEIINKVVTNFNKLKITRLMLILKLMLSF